MASPLFDDDADRKLPLWAQVLLAVRMIRRAVGTLSLEATEGWVHALDRGCEAVEQCARAGEWSTDDRAVIDGVRRELGACSPPHDDLRDAFNAVADATHAAHDALDFSAAESACTGSCRRAVAHAGAAAATNPLQFRILHAADLDSIRFACGEFHRGRYDALGPEVFGRLLPIPTHGRND